MLRARRRWLALALASALMAAGAPAIAQTQAPVDDAAFAREMLQVGRIEQEAAQLAMQRALSPSVKGFAEDVLDTIPKVYGALVPLAERRGLPTQSALPPDGAELLQALRELKGADFDNAYARRIAMQLQERTVALLEQGAERLRDEELRSFASSRLPAVRVLYERGRKLTAEVAPVQ